jgi:hypothetical protein
MIDRLFVKGARYLWTPPAAITTQPMDGAIVVTPAAPPGLMTYVGLDGEIVDRGLPHVSTLGLSMNMPIQYQWLSYIHGRTAKINTTSDVLTGFMSGCWIATWTDATGHWIGHLGTVESAGKNQPPNTTVKQQFASQMPNNVQAYKPSDWWAFHEIMVIANESKAYPEAKILSLVTGNGELFSILMLRRMNEPSIWVCGGKKLANAVAHGELAAALA